jgi:hypothetical protein
MTETLRRGYPGMKVIASERLGCAPRGSKGSRHKCIADPSQMGLHVMKDKLVTFSWFLLFYIRHLVMGIAPSLDIISKCACVSMQSIKDMPVLQDGPPPGGFPSVRYARRIPSTGPAGFTLFAVTASIMAYGFIKVCPPPQPTAALDFHDLQ